VHSDNGRKVENQISLFMETFLILFVFAFCPLALFTFIIVGAIHRAKQQKKVWDAADKYLKS
jgi:hypothetical protein